MTMPDMYSTPTGPAAGGTHATTSSYAEPPQSNVTRTTTSSIKRIFSIARAETLLFVRNPTIALTALGLPLVMVVLLLPIGDSADGAAFSRFLVHTLAVWALLLVVYVNLTTIFVSRREDGVFQRMSTGEASPWEALIAASLPPFAVVLAQVIVGVAATLILFDGAILTDPLLILVALIGTTVFLGGISAWTSRFTTTVEGAQYSTMPIMMLLIFASGTLLPTSVLPEQLARLCEFTPLYTAAELLGLGMGSAEGGFLTAWTEAAQPLAVLAAWAVLGIILAKRTMVFTRRR